MNSPTLSSTPCPRCRKPVLVEDINVATDSALCRLCGASFRFSESLDHLGHPISLDRPPAGVTLQPAPAGWLLTATTRGWEAFILVPVVLVWSFFIVGGIYGSQIREGRFDLVDSVFGIPFLLVSFLVGSNAAMAAAGRVIVTMDTGFCTVFQGVGPFGLTRTFSWHDVSVVSEGPAYTRNWGSPRLISIFFRNGSSRPYRFGTLLSDERRRFLLAFLRSRLEA